MSPPFGRGSRWSRRGQSPNADPSTSDAHTLGSRGSELRPAETSPEGSLSSPWSDTAASGPNALLCGDWRPSRCKVAPGSRPSGGRWGGVGGSGSGARAKTGLEPTLPPLPKGVPGERNGLSPEQGIYWGYLKPLNSISTFIEHLLCALKSSRSLGSPSECNVKTSLLFPELLFLVTGNHVPVDLCRCFQLKSEGIEFGLAFFFPPQKMFVNVPKIQRKDWREGGRGNLQ